jgi:23S rRNA (pseudouridine1915-N3)-methyltransferase
MKIVILAISKTDENFINDGVKEFIKRINLFCQVDFEIINEPKNHSKLPILEQIQVESKLIEKFVQQSDIVVLLDEKGKSYSSVEFSKQMELWLNSNKKRLVFVIGGPFGISELLKNKYFTLSLSNMTFNHQLIRLLLLEQIYRAFTIIKGLPYHK